MPPHVLSKRVANLEDPFSRLPSDELGMTRHYSQLNQAVGAMTVLSDTIKAHKYPPLNCELQGHSEVLIIDVGAASGVASKEFLLEVMTQLNAKKPGEPKQILYHGVALESADKFHLPAALLAHFLEALHLDENTINKLLKYPEIRRYIEFDAPVSEEDVDLNLQRTASEELHKMLDKTRIVLGYTPHDFYSERVTNVYRRVVEATTPNTPVLFLQSTADQWGPFDGKRLNDPALSQRAQINLASPEMKDAAYESWRQLQTIFYSRMREAVKDRTAFLVSAGLCSTETGDFPAKRAYEAIDEAARERRVLVSFNSYFPTPLQREMALRSSDLTAGYSEEFVVSGAKSIQAAFDRNPGDWPKEVASTAMSIARQWSQWVVASAIPRTELDDFYSRATVIFEDRLKESGLVWEEVSSKGVIPYAYRTEITRL